MAEPNATTPTLRQDVADWVGTHYATAVDEAYADALTIPNVTVRPYARKLSADLSGYLVDLQLVSLARATTGGNRRGHTILMDLVAPSEDADASGELDRMLSLLLDTLTTTSRGLNWTSAQYVIRDDSFPAFRITIELEEVS